MPSLPKWTTPAERQPGWEIAYARTVQEHVDRPFEWGKSDCLIVPADVCLAMCGRNPMPQSLRTYRSEEGAAAMLRSLGFDDVEQALDAVFPRIAPALARRGDAGVVEVRRNGITSLAAVVVIGEKAVGKGVSGPVLISTLRMRSAFAIGSI